MKRGLSFFSYAAELHSIKKLNDLIKKLDVFMNINECKLTSIAFKYEHTAVLLST